MELTLEFLKKVEANLRNMDTDKDGRVSVAEFKSYIAKMDITQAIYIASLLDVESTEDIAEAVDLDKDGYIVLTEFLGAFGVK